jgi:hypothetical protein
MHKVKVTKRQRKFAKGLALYASSMVKLCLEKGSQVVVGGRHYVGSVPKFVLKYATPDAINLPNHFVKVVKGVPFIRVF